jgi:hypothetical protein
MVYSIPQSSGVSFLLLFYLPLIAPVGRFDIWESPLARGPPVARGSQGHKRYGPSDTTTWEMLFPADTVSLHAVGRMIYIFGHGLNDQHVLLVPSMLLTLLTFTMSSWCPFLRRFKYFYVSHLIDPNQLCNDQLAQQLMYSLETEENRFQLESALCWISAIIIDGL